MQLALHIFENGPVTNTWTTQMSEISLAYFVFYFSVAEFNNLSEYFVSCVFQCFAGLLAVKGLLLFETVK